MATGLRELRMRQLHSLRSLAAAAGCTVQTVHDAERGRKLPTFGTMRKIAAALGAAPADIAEFVAAIEARAQGKDAA
jgi:transcriptional regulator with XRE-family HTH domain